MRPWKKSSWAEVSAGRNFPFHPFQNVLWVMEGLEIVSASPTWTESWRAEKEQTFISFSWKYRVFLNCFTEGLEGASVIQVVVADGEGSSLGLRQDTRGCCTGNHSPQPSSSSPGAANG